MNKRNMRETMKFLIHLNIIKSFQISIKRWTIVNIGFVRGILLIFVIVSMAACVKAPSGVSIQSNTREPEIEKVSETTLMQTDFQSPGTTPKSTNTVTTEPTVILILEPTQTPILFQVLGRIFPDGSDSVGVWANQNSGALDSRNTHFDVALPLEFSSLQNFVLAPASGRIVEVYSVGDNGEGGQVVTIQPDPPLEGIDELALKNGIEPSSIVKVYFHIGHITALKTTGRVEKGEPIGTPFDIPGIDKIAYVIRVIMDTSERQFSPCDLPNTAEFCGVCAPGTPNPCP
jgi:hypothetical protein